MTSLNPPPLQHDVEEDDVIDDVIYDVIEEPSDSCPLHAVAKSKKILQAGAKWELLLQFANKKPTDLFDASFANRGDVKILTQWQMEVCALECTSTGK